MFLQCLVVLVLGVNLSWTAPQASVTTQDKSGIIFEETTDTPDFRKDYIYEVETETFYKEHTTSKNWSEAIATCKLEGAKLAVPFTKIEADMVQKHFTGKSYYTWLGIHDLFTEGKFITLNGTRAADIYTNWNLYEPNDAGGIEDCVTMTKEGKYNDIPCNLESTFICTKHRSDITRYYDCETTIKGYFFENEAERCYKIHTTPKTWREAYSICDSEEASLAMANSQAEADLFIKFLARHPENSLKGNFIKDVIILDFTDIITRGDFMTSNGKTLEESGYSAWLEGQPGNLDDKEHCGSMRRDGKLNSIGCEERALFVCEKPLKLSIQYIDPRFGDKGGVKNRYSK